MNINNTTETPSVLSFGEEKNPVDENTLLLAHQSVEWLREQVHSAIGRDVFGFVSMKVQLKAGQITKITPTQEFTYT